MKKKLLTLFLALSLLVSLALPFSVMADAPAITLLKSDGSEAGDFETPADALRSAASKKLNNFTLRLERDVTLTKTWLLNNTAAYRYTFDGNGKAIRMQSDDPATPEVNEEVKVAAVKIYGNNEASVTLKNLHVESHGNAVECVAGTVRIESGYYYSDSTVYATNAVLCRADKTDATLKVEILGGYFVRHYDGEEDAEAVIKFRNDMEANFHGIIYGGYFAAEGTVNFVISVADYAKGDIYGGTFLTGYERGDIVISTGNSDATVAQVFGGNFIHAENGNQIFRNNNKGTRKCVMRVTGGNFIGAKMIFDDLGDDNQDIYHADATKRTTLNATAPLETLGAFVLLEQNTLGIGFEATLPEATAAALRAIADEGTDPRTGMLICNRDDLESVPYLSRDVLLAKGADYADISCKAKAPESGDPVYQAAIRGIDRKHLDTQFAAIPYVAVTVNGCEVYYYGLWNEGQAFSMRLIAELALEDVQDAAGAGYENAVASGSQTGKFSPYTTEQRGLLDAYR